MRCLSFTLASLLMAACAQGLPASIISRPFCDSPDAEAAAVVAQDYLNAQHTHGYKYVLNRIEDIKIISTASGEETYVMEIDLLETTCHVLDPTPLANCTVRSKMLTAVEGDCDVLLEKVGGVLSVSAFKCKTEESTEDLCVGCPVLLPLNHTDGLAFVHSSLRTFNGISNNTFSLMEVGRMSLQVVSARLVFVAEYVAIEANCTDTVCAPLNNPERAFCVAQGSAVSHTVDCHTFGVLPNNMPEVNATTPSDPALLPVIHANHAVGHHKLTSIYNPQLSGHLSAESGESDEVVPVISVLVAPSAAVNQILPDPIVDVPIEIVEVPIEIVEVPIEIVEVLAPATTPTTDDVPKVDDVPSADIPDDSNTKTVVVKRAVVESVVPVVPVVAELPVLPQRCPGRIRHY